MRHQIRKLLEERQIVRDDRRDRRGHGLLDVLGRERRPQTLWLDEHCYI
jgi:hypothetical protein